MAETERESQLEIKHILQNYLSNRHTVCVKDCALHNQIYKNDNSIYILVGSIYILVGSIHHPQKYKKNMARPLKNCKGLCLGLFLGLCLACTFMCMCACAYDGHNPWHTVYESMWMDEETKLPACPNVKRLSGKY